MTGKFYRLMAENEKTRKRTILTTVPLCHKCAATTKNKFLARQDRNIVFEDVQASSCYVCHSKEDCSS